jgi:hypothetical protein
MVSDACFPPKEHGCLCHAASVCREQCGVNSGSESNGFGNNL